MEAEPSTADADASGIDADDAGDGIDGVVDIDGAVVVASVVGFGVSLPRRSQALKPEASTAANAIDGQRQALETEESIM